MMKQNDISTKIISAIEREEIDDKVKKYISEADKFLFNIDKNTIKPDFIDDFLDKTKNILISTVNGCIKSRNNPKKKDDLKKYKEGYFNEIIQNANDIVLYSGIENPTIEIECKKADNIYEIICSYPDKGFSLKDIYGFCSRGNSNKSSESGQEGMYGIGIKSLFCFATYFCIENNIKIEIDSNEGVLDNIKIDCLNICPQKTKLKLRFEYNEGRENKHAGFNVKKIAKFIDSLIDNKDCDEFFYSEKEEEVLFDHRSLMFTELRSNRTHNNSIKSIKFIGNENELILNVFEKFYKKDENKVIKISKIKDDMEYIVFHYNDPDEEEKSLSIAYAVNREWENLNDRIYATYFVGNYSSLLEKKTGCLVNTKAINSSRSGLERENEDNPAILQTIKCMGKETVRDLIDIINNDETSDEWKKISSDILCHLIYVYKEQQSEENEEILPNGIFNNKLKELVELFNDNKLYLMENKNYIFDSEDDIKDSSKIDIESEMINKNRPGNSDDNNCKLLYSIYKKKFIGIYEDKDTDIIYFNDDKFKSLYFGVKKLAEEMFKNRSDDKNTYWIQCMGMPFIKGAKELIQKRIKGNDFESIMKFISSCKEEERILVKQLIARFEVNNSFDYMGNFSNNNILNWLLCDKIDDEDFNGICNEYKKFYGELKELFGEEIPSIRCYSSNHPNASPDYWYENFAKNDFDMNSNNEKEIQQFLNILSKDIFKFGYKESVIGNCLFINNHKNNIILRNRKRTTTNWNYKFKYLNVDFLNRIVLDFNRFKLFRESIDKYNEKQSDDRFKINYLKRCKIKTANLVLIEDMFRWLSNYEEEVKIDIEELKDIVWDDTDLIKFAKLFLKDVNIHLQKIDAGNSGKKFIGYITNFNSDYYTIKFKRSASDSFKTINNEKYLENKDRASKADLIIFYSNSNEQIALSEVLKDVCERIGEDLISYIENFINSDNIKQLTVDEYNKYLERAERYYKYPFEYENVQSFIVETNEFKIEDIYTILSGEMSYYDHCPICHDIPTLNISNETEGSKKKNILVTIIPALYEGKKIYVKIIACKSCFEEYKVSLTEAEVLKKDKQIILQLKSNISDSSRNYNFVREIKISPDNWKIIRDFNNIN